MKTLKPFVFVFCCMLLMSCDLKPIMSEYNFIKSDIENVQLSDLGNGDVLIHNGSNVFHKIDNTARLNIWLDGKPMGQLKPSEYVIINLSEGTHTFKLLHIDVVNMRSEHEVEISSDTKIIMVKPTLTSNKLEVTNEFPRNWHKFKYVLSGQ